MNTKYPKRRSTRLLDFDYSQAGAYFVTICARNKKCIFGQITGTNMQLNSTGTLIGDCWEQLAQMYPFIELDSWVIMPNHFHAIVWLREENSVRKSLSEVIAAFKTTSTSKARKLLSYKNSLWQRGFFEHIIRDQNDLFRIRQYITDNPVQWVVDSENPDVVKSP